MKSTRIVCTVIVLMVLAVAVRLYSQAQVPPQTASPRTLSFLILFGTGDRAAATWDGSITATGADILSLQGWRFSGTDAIDGSTWQLSTRLPPGAAAAPPPGGGPGGGAPAGPVPAENGVIVTISENGSPVTFNVQTAQGNFSFSSQDVPFGTSLTLLDGRALVAQTPSSLAVASSNEEEDYPAIAQSGDDVYLAYTRFVHGDRSLAQATNTDTPITNFDFLSRPTGGDQVLMLHYSKSTRVWTGPFAITSTGEDVMRTAVSVDGQGRAWIIYAARRSGNFDLFARWTRANGVPSSEVRITTDAGSDLSPVAATDTAGRVWVAWQGFRNNNLEVLAAVQQTDSFSPETVVSTSPASDWDPAIAAAPGGDVAISWDTYDKGDYDVYLRRGRFNGKIAMDNPIPIAASVNFEARSSLAYDAIGRLWIAYETSGPKWGKDFGTADTSGVALYQNHSIAVRCLIGADLYATTDPVARVMPGTPAAQFFAPAVNAGPPVQPNPAAAQNRQPNAGVPAAIGLKNSFPRLTTDSEGAVYLAFRHPAGNATSTSVATGDNVGSVWTEEMVYFDGAQWSSPGVFANADGLLDNRPALLALSPGRLLIAQAMDHRLSPLPGGTPQIDGVNSDIYALELPVARTAQPPILDYLPPLAPARPDPSVATEAASVTRMTSYRPTVNGQTLQLVRGDFHRHTELSFDGPNDGPLIDAYRYSIDAAALNWVGCCDHDDGGAREYSWWMVQKYTDAYLLGTRFMPMFYYERSIAYPEGHRNIMFAQRGIRPLPRLPISAVDSTDPAPDTNMLYAYLKRFGGLTASHTSGTTLGTDWRNNDPDVETTVEIYQGDRQSYEMANSPRAVSADDAIGGYREKGFVSNALGMGYKLGFEASSDHVSTHISFTNLWVTEPTRAGILDAMAKRRVYGSTDNILADFRSGSHYMGESFTSSSAPEFTVQLWGTNAFQNVSVIKDNEVVYSTSGDSVLSFTWQDTTAQAGKTSYYYVRGLQTDGQVVWVSPIWVTLQ